MVGKKSPMSQICRFCNKDCLSKGAKIWRNNKKPCSMCGRSFLNECEKRWRYWCTPCCRLWEDLGYELQIHKIDQQVKEFERDRKQVFEVFRNYVANLNPSEDKITT